MTSHSFLTLSLSALILGGTTAGCASDRGGRVLASAGSRSVASADKAASRVANRANSALARHRPDMAVPLAEKAVALRPRDAGIRVLLGRSYLKAGRFASASAAFTDALALEPGNGKAALNLALGQIGTGDWAGARRTLTTHEAIIPAGDRGLALALAGDPATGAELLIDAVRRPDADVTTRQNLALALALAGRWQESRAVAAADLSPADIDKRMAEWAAFAQPSSAYDQVAALLGVVPVVDGGQPLALALPLPIAAKPVQTAVQPFLPPAPSPEAEAGAAEPVAVVQPLPAPVAARITPAHIFISARPTRTASTFPARRGRYFVQLGAYQNAAVAHDGWSHIVRRFPAIASHAPLGAMCSVSAGTLYRLSIGGFSRRDATMMCQSYKAKGGACFIRPAAGEQVAAWASSTGSKTRFALR